MHFLRIRIIVWAMLLILFLPACLATAQTIYTWTDENGVRRMSNIEPVAPESEVEVMELKPTANSPEPRTEYTQPVTPPADEYETKVAISDNHVIVPVRLIYNQKEVQARLLLDTGSSNITLHRKFAKKLSVSKTRKGFIRVAGGDLVEAQAIRLDSVTVGPYTRKKLMAGIIEHNGPEVAFDGLLGMNFLKHYQYTIDFDSKLLRWGRQ